MSGEAQCLPQNFILCLNFVTKEIYRIYDQITKIKINKVGFYLGVNGCFFSEEKCFHGYRHLSTENLKHKEVKGKF